MADTWVPLARDYELERSTAPLRRAPAIDHPFLHKEKPSNRGGVSMVVKKPSTAAAAAAAAEETKAVDDDDPLGLNDPLSGGNPGDADDPLSAYMASDDPLSAYEADPLSGGGGGGGGGAGGGGGRGGKGEEARLAQEAYQQEMDTPWNVQKNRVLAEYATASIRVKASFLDDAASMDDGSQKQQSVSAAKERLMALQGRGPEDTLELSQKEYMDHITKLHGELITAWNTEEKVLSLKLAIQCAKLLSDVDVPQFYPIMFCLVSDILDTFGTLVYERIKARAEEVLTQAAGGAPQRLKEGWVSSDVPTEAKETCRNWFYKTACIRELLPRLYLELALLRCFRFLSDNEYPQVIARLSCMIRGVGDPLVASFARVYLSRGADMVAGMGCETMPPEDVAAAAADRANKAGGSGAGGRLGGSEVSERGCSKHTLGALYDFMFTFKDFEEHRLAHYLKTVGVERNELLRLMSPAVEWMMRVLGNGAGKDVFIPVIQHYRGYAANTMVLKHVLNSFNGNLWVANGLAFVALIKEAAESNVSHAEVLGVFARKCMHTPPPKEQRMPMLNEAWGVVRKERDLPTYTTACAAWIELLLRHYSDREVLILLKDLVTHLEDPAANVDAENVLVPLEQVVRAIVEHSGADFGSLLTSDAFLAVMAVFKGPRKAAVCKTLLEQFGRRPDPTGDIVLINAVFDMARSLHDSVDSLSEDSERTHIARLICAFIDKMDFGADLEGQLNIYVECRGAFCNLDDVQDRLVLGVVGLAARAHKFMKGRHTKKTGAFVKACLAFCHITIPSIECVFARMHLMLLCGNVALINACLPQTDTFFKGAVSLIPEAPEHVMEEHKRVSTELRMVSFVKQYCAAMLMVPGHPQHGPFYLVRCPTLARHD